MTGQNCLIMGDSGNLSSRVRISQNTDSEKNTIKYKKKCWGFIYFYASVFGVSESEVSPHKQSLSLLFAPVPSVGST